MTETFLVWFFLFVVWVLIFFFFFEGGKKREGEKRSVTLLPTCVVSKQKQAEGILKNFTSEVSAFVVVVLSLEKKKIKTVCSELSSSD